MALRKTMCCDAVVQYVPNWASLLQNGTTINVIMAPWFQKDHIGPIMEGLYNQLRIRGLDYVKNSIVFQEVRYDDDLVGRSRHIVETEGSNMLVLARSTLIVPETIRSSNVVEMCTVLGISCGISALQVELQKVLSFDSANIDSRHIWLLADTMGRSGSLGAMNRHHMESMGSSVLQRASFEQSLDVFEEGASFGKTDPLSGATERIITGQAVCIGTGLVGIVSSALNEAAPGVVVAPMSTSEQSSKQNYIDQGVVAGLVKPNKNLGFPESVASIKHKNNQNLSEITQMIFTMPLLDMEKISSSSFFEMCCTKFRATAALKRLHPLLRFTMAIAEPCFFDHLMRTFTSFSCWSNQSKKTFQQVHWTMPKATKLDTHGITEVEGPGKSVSFNCEMFHTLLDNNNSLTCEILAVQPMDPLEIPFGVSTFNVVYIEETTFLRAPFVTRLRKYWSSENNLETEQNALYNKANYAFILESMDSQNLLQNRCTDAQLGNALHKRISAIFN